MPEIKEQIINLLSSTGRKGIENLIKYMEDNGFFTAPCSTEHHLCKEGGLAEHSLNVYNTMLDLSYLADRYEIIEAAGGQEALLNSTKIVSLLHDLGKMGQFGKPGYIENHLKKDDKVSTKKPYIVNPLLLNVPHEIRSIQIASQFIELTEQENYAILMHNALYGDLKYAYSGKETPLSMLLHFSDLWSSRVIEKEE